MAVQFLFFLFLIMKKSIFLNKVFIKFGLMIEVWQAVLMIFFYVKS
jgi:hypothetical protein